MPPAWSSRVLTWNIYHGRDGPPDKALYTRWAEWTRRTERNETHVQVNRDLWREYTDMICAAEWDIALLQECPPRWQPGFARECGADSYRSMTSRNWLEQLSWRIARGWPDLIGSWRGRLQPDPGARRRRRDRREPRHRDPERQARAPHDGLRQAQLGPLRDQPARQHQPSPRRGRARARRREAIEWAGEGAPLVFGGDFNVRPYQQRHLQASSRPISASRASRPRTRSTTCSPATWK